MYRLETALRETIREMGEAESLVHLDQATLSEMRMALALTSEIKRLTTTVERALKARMER